jgi:hypothetical protein
MQNSNQQILNQIHQLLLNIRKTSEDANKTEALIKELNRDLDETERTSADMTKKLTQLERESLDKIDESVLEYLSES